MSYDGLLKRPPMIQSPLTPESVYGYDDMRLLQDFLKAVLPCRGRDEWERVVSKFQPGQRARCAELMAQSRMAGYYPETLDGNGSIVWGIALKGDVQIEIERNGDFYEQRGKEVKERGGDFLGVMPIADDDISFCDVQRR